MTFQPQTTWRVHLPRHPDLPYLRDWLFDQGSLTSRLQNKGAFSVRVLAQRPAMPMLDETRALELPRRQRARIREVALLVDGEPLVFAHTVLPITNRGPLTRWLARLGTRSLGSMLFAHPGFYRSAIECKALDRRHPLHQRAIKALLLPDQTTLWARRSCFGFGTQAIFVTEVFSPALCQKPTPSRWFAGLLRKNHSASVRDDS